MGLLCPKKKKKKKGGVKTENFFFFFCVVQHLWSHAVWAALPPTRYAAAFAIPTLTWSAGGACDDASGGDACASLPLPTHLGSGLLPRVGLVGTSTAEAEHKVQGGLLLDVVVLEGAAILELLAREDEALLVRRDALLILDLGLDSLEGDGLTRKGLDEDLHNRCLC